jgi:hypothetical protein
MTETDLNIEAAALKEGVESAQVGGKRVAVASKVFLITIWAIIAVILVGVIVGIATLPFWTKKIVGTNAQPVKAESDKTDMTENPTVQENDNNNTSVEQIREQGGLNWGW